MQVWPLSPTSPFSGRLPKAFNMYRQVGTTLVSEGPERSWKVLQPKSQGTHNFSIIYHVKCMGMEADTCSWIVHACYDADASKAGARRTWQYFQLVKLQKTSWTIDLQTLLESHIGERKKKIGEKNTSVWTEMGSRQEKMNVHLCLRLCRNISSHKVFVVPHDPLSDFAQQSCGKLVNIYIEDPRTHISESNLQL